MSNDIQNKFPKLTLANVRKFALTARPFAAEVMAARAACEITRAKVEPVKNEIFASYTFTLNPELCGRRGEVKIDSPSKLYLAAEDDLCEEFYAEVSAELKSRGIKPADMPDEFCPLLVAENAVRDAEAKIIKHFSETFGIGEIWNMELRKKALDLAMTRIDG